MVPTGRHSEKGKMMGPVNRSAAARGEGDGLGGEEASVFRAVKSLCTTL